MQPVPFVPSSYGTVLNLLNSVPEPVPLRSCRRAFSSRGPRVTVDHAPASPPGKLHQVRFVSAIGKPVVGKCVSELMDVNAAQTCD